jgi:hypothetical protein
MSSFRRLLAAAVIFVCSLSAQVTGRLSGILTDPSGAAVPAARISLAAEDSTEAAYSTTSTEEGNFLITAIRPGTYSLKVEAAGFVTRTDRNVIVQGGRENSLPPIQLALGSVSQTVDVQEQSQGVQTTNAEVTTTISNSQIRLLPQLNRSPLALLTTQAGVTYNGRTNTTINGQRVSFSNVTLDGVNIQDNFIRTNALDFLPNLLLLDQVGEMMIATSNVNPALGNGSSQVAFISPSGGNQYHGALLWTNRNNAFAANTWFNNQRSISRPFLNQNQVGGSIGGRIIRDKLFFYANYEAFRLRQQSTNQTLIPTEDARNGIFTYSVGSEVRKVNLLQAAGLPADPNTAAILKAMPASNLINDYTVGDSTAALLRNSGGYSFLIRNNRTRDNMLSKLDYILNTKHSFTGTYAWNRDLLDRTDLAYDFAKIPKVSNDNATPFLSAAWRWTPTPTLTNEARGGVNIAPGLFLSSETFPRYLLATAAMNGLGGLFSPTYDPFRAQGRYTDTYNISDNATWVRGRHTVAFGIQYQSIRIRSFNDVGITPTYTLGMSGNNPNALSTTQLPGVSTNDLTTANNLLAVLAGQVSAYTQTFNVTGRSSGFVPGATNQRDYILNYYAGYVQDTWKIHPRFTLSGGLRYDLFTPVDERNGLLLTPQLINGDPIRTLLNPNAVLDFAGTSAGKPLYATDKNNFAPNLGLAWDVFGDGKMAVRAGYSIAFVNDDTVRAVVGSAGAASGLARAAAGSGLAASVANLPAIAAPTYKVPLTLAENYALSASGVIGLPDPNLRNPYVQQWNLSIQREFKGFILDARYLGNHGTKLYRGIDLNQVNIGGSGFLDDFRRAQSNQALSIAAGKGNNPAYDATIAGSQPLNGFNQLVGQGTLSNATTRTLIQQGQVGTLATNYITARQAGTVPLQFNNQILNANYLTNYSNSTYNALQLDVTRRYRNGLQMQYNYTFSKALSDASGDGQTRVEPFLDINNAKLEKSRAPFDVTHAFKANGIYELPLGVGKRWISTGLLSRVIGGWSMSGIAIWNSGNPISIISGRGPLNNTTVNGINPSLNNTATTTLNRGQLDDILGFYMTGNGPYMIAQSALNPADKRGVAQDGTAPFAGQVFFNPAAGTVGTLQRRMFSGPTNFNLDAGLQKKVNITERQFVEFRAEAINVLNHPTFYIADMDINSTTFGKIGSQLNSRRVFQFGLQYRF